MAIYCNKFSKELMNSIQRIYGTLKNDQTVYSFYFDLLFKQTLSYCKAEGVKETRDVVEYAVKKFIKDKITANELIPRYNIQCISCRKKIYGPVSSLDDLPDSCVCPYCNEVVDLKDSFIYYDLRYMFVERQDEIKF